ncbi:MAG TPA: hypothetical protein VMC84_01560 [Methanocella sp.]|uniref:hypothetical protein n=1 Tax=Methanocella sp. TaxID=2052833 RepID=UPI002C3841E2|nr:hypothetical protein [Methanocella sp.]HTY89840.1 hypothetical protein [Methanocella sp.]
MAEQAVFPEKVSSGAKIVFILLAGALSMFFAEVCSGSSVLWFLTPWAWIVTFWLYLAHTVFFINLALYFRRTSLTALYLWGVLFGLYESWITKVAWAGYAGQAPGIGTFLGFAIPEFPIITFFWHPVFSFILPMLAFQALSGRVLPGHLQVLIKSRRNWILSALVVILGSAILAFNSKSNLVATVVTALGSFALIGALYLIASKRYGKQFSIESLRLGKAGMTLLLIYLAALYILTFIFILPERTAPPLTILLTLGVYAAIILLLYLKKPDAVEHSVMPDGKSIFGPGELTILAVTFTIMGALFCLVPTADHILTPVLYFGLVLLSPALLLWAVVNVVRFRQKTKAAV